MRVKRNTKKGKFDYDEEPEFMTEEEWEAHENELANKADEDRDS